MSHPQRQPQIPQRIGPFRVLSLLGRGAMGVVLKAQQEGLDRTVALKVLAPHIAHDATFIERFQREARVSAKLNHPNVVQGIDVGRDATSGLWYFAMEFIEGTTAGALLKDHGALSEREALKIARDVASALSCAAANNIVHRDIKPENILIDTQGTAKLADLGLARQRNDDASLTQSGQTVGTPYYMAPEQVEGRLEAIDIRSDLYALGATLFHFVTGRPPLEGPSPAVIMAKHLSDRPLAANRVAPEVSVPCSNLIAWMLEKDPVKRPQHPDEVASALDELLRNPAASTRAARSVAPLTRTGRRPGESTSRQNPVRGATTGLGAVGGMRADSVSRRRGQRRGVPFLAIGVGAVLLLAAYLLLGGPGKSAPMGESPHTETGEIASKNVPEVHDSLHQVKTDAKTKIRPIVRNEPIVAVGAEARPEPPKPPPPVSVSLPADAKPADEKLEIPADAIVWNGNAGDGAWTNPKNWVGGQIPGPKSDAAFTGAAGDTTIGEEVSVNGLYLGEGYRGTLRLTEGANLCVRQGGISVYGGRLDGGRGRMRSEGGLTQRGGVLAVPGGGLAVGRSLTIRGGKFSGGNGPLEIVETATVIDAPEARVGDLTVEMKGNLTVQGNLRVDGTLRLVHTNSVLEGTIYAAGDVITEKDKPLSSTNATICLCGTGEQRLISKASPGFLPSVRIEKPSGKVRLEGSLCVQACWMVEKGDVVAGESTVWIGQGKPQLKASGMIFNHLGVETQGNVRIEGTVRVRGDFILRNANSLEGGELLVGGRIALQVKKSTFTTPITQWKDLPSE